MQALVTGGSGFIGSELIGQLTQKGIRVRALLRKTSLRHNLEKLEFETALGDLGDVDSLKKALEGVDYVFHLAGAITAANHAEFFRHNAEGTANLACACAEVNPGLKRFVYVSSIAASGPASDLNPRLESEIEHPVSVYGESKLGGEHELIKWAKSGSKSFPVTIVRPPAVYGPRDKAIFEFVKIINAGILPILPSKTQTGDKYYSVIHVDDLVRGILLAGLAEGQSEKEIFFLSGDGVYTWAQLMTQMAHSLNRKALRVRIPAFALSGLSKIQTAAGRITKKTYPLTLDKVKELNADYWICSNERAKKILGFHPKWEMKEGMANAISWYKNQGWL